MKWLTQWAITSGVLILIVLAVRYLFRDKLSARLRYALWAVVLLRLLAPFQIPLPAPVSDSLPLLASNLAPETAQWETPSIPVFPERSKSVAEFNLDIETTLEPGDILSYSDGAGCLRRDGETITWYRYILSPEQIVLALWLSGTGLAGTVMLASNLRFALRLRKRRKPLEVPDSPVRVYAAECLPSPCLFGVFRPAVYVTPEAAENPDALRHVLAHELTHHAHRDHLWSLLRCLALALHWYNPLVWLAAALSKRDGELACDEGAVARLGEEDRIPYGRTLVNMVARQSRPADLLSCSTAMTGGKKSIQQRVARLIQKPETVKAALFAVVAVVSLAAVFVFTGREESQRNLYGPYKYQVDRTQAVRYSPSPISSQFYPDPITDPDLLEKALDLLDSAADLLNTPEELGLDLSDAPFLSSRVTLLEDPDDYAGGHTYLLYTPYTPQTGRSDRCYLVTPAEIGAESYAVAAVLDASASGALESLARQQQYREREDLTPATFDYNRYHAQLEAAQGIWLNMPMLHDGHVLTDPEELEQVKELLVLTPVPRGGPLEWDGVWSDSIAFSTGLPDADWTGADNSVAYYVVSADEELCYVCSGSNGEGGYILGTAPKSSWEQARKILLEAPTVDDRQHARNALLGDLTQEQADQVNEAFRFTVLMPDGSYGLNEISCFFTSSYNDPTQINLEEFLRYCPLGEVLEDDEVEEFRVVMAEDKTWTGDYSNRFPSDFMVPVHRYPREEVSALLQKYAGVTVEDLEWPETLTYVEKYDAFYNFTSDAGPGTFYCEGGKIDGDVVLLWSEPNENGDRCELTLRKSGERWLIQSHHTIYER